ncbi:MAG: tagaturonate reductase [Phaeodactylibacter sp.]|nr:tagaturonate reductase [Phaeodactylibacter sp.]
MQVAQKAALPVRILQFGEGNFLRAFVDWIVHRMNMEAGFGGGVAVVQPIGRGLIPLLNEQDGLYTLYLRGIRKGEAVSEHELIDCIQKGIDPYQDFEAYLEEARNPELRFIISNTTEAGITFNENDSLGASPPESFPGKLAVFLFHRFRHFAGDRKKGCIIIPCELIDRNGDKLKEILLQYARLWKLGIDFEQWLEVGCIFCNTLVDRIVPGYPRDRIEEIWQELGYKDQLVCEGELFHLWVIEAPDSVRREFPSEKAGLNVLFTDNMEPYRTRKVRILNGAHTSMVPVSYLYGIDTVRETVEHPVLGTFVRETIFEEIIPTLDLPKAELEQFAKDVLDRFRNPFIKHYLISIALNSVSKFKTRVLPSLLEYAGRKGTLPRRIVFSLAALIYFYKGERNGQSIPLQDDDWVIGFLKAQWDQNDGTAKGMEKLAEAVLQWEEAWGQDLSETPGLQALLAKYLFAIERDGMEKAVKAL